MRAHEHFEELAARSAGGLRSDPEHGELRKHTNACADCRNAQPKFSELIRSALPLTVAPVREFADRVKTKTDDGMRRATIFGAFQQSRSIFR